MIDISSIAEKWCGWTLFDKTMNRLMSCSQKTSYGNKEMIIFTIAKQFKQLTLACKSKNIGFHYTFVRLENFRKRIQICSLMQNKNHYGFSRLKFAWIPSVHDNRSRKRAAGNSSVIHFFNKHSIVKLFISSARPNY